MSAKTPDPWRLFHVGDFFTELALNILGGDKTSSNLDCGDIENFDLGSLIEVKACGNSNNIKIFHEQLIRVLEERGFPLDETWYAIFSYRNNFRESKRSMTKETPTRKLLDKYLAQNILFMYLVDARVLEAISIKDGLRSCRRVHEVVNVLNMNKKTLYSFNKKPKETFKKYKLKGFDIKEIEIKDSFRSNDINFTMTMILPKKQINKVIKNLSRQYNLPFTEEQSSSAAAA